MKIGRPVSPAQMISPSRMVLDAEPLRQRRREWVEVLETIPVARDEARTGSVDFEQRAEESNSDGDEIARPSAGLFAPKPPRSRCRVSLFSQGTKCK
jgi:hypothetical protein